MKKLTYIFSALAIAAFSLNSCEDVPAPFDYQFEKPAVVEPIGEGTEASPYNVAKALAVIKAGPSTDLVYVKGIVVEVTSMDIDNYGSAEYFIADAEGSTTRLQVYHGKYYNGAKFTSLDQLKVGDEVLLKGQLINYNNTPEVQTGSQIITINGKADTSTPTVKADVTITAAQMGMADGTENGSVTLSDGTTLTFGAGTGAKNAKYYTSSKAVRVYDNNTITIAASRPIAKVEITTSDPYQGTKYNGNDEAYALNGEQKVVITKSSDTQVSFTPLSSNKVTIVNANTGSTKGTDLRVVSVAITYVTAN